jgi:enoyl-CoA hydratase/carnithine racemase
MGQIQTSIASGVLHAVMARPERKNALTDAMYVELELALEAAVSDPAVKAVLVSGAQGVFTAGNDLDGFVTSPPRDAQAPVFRMLRRLALFSKPVVAAVEGLAIGVGTTMLLHCDLVYASPDARFALPFVNLGLVPEGASSVLLPQLAGYQRAAEKLLLGDPFPAEEALAMGLVNRIVPSEELLSFARQQATRLASLPTGSVADTKALMRLGQRGSMREPAIMAHMDEEIRRFADRLGMPALQEAVSAFREKRKPVFTDME